MDTERVSQRVQVSCVQNNDRRRTTNPERSSFVNSFGFESILYEQRGQKPKCQMIDVGSFCSEPSSGWFRLQT